MPTKQRAKPVRRHVLDLMLDGAWRTPMQIMRKLEDRGVFTTAHMEKLRDLRKPQYGHWPVECRAKPGRAKGSQLCEYRIAGRVEPVRSDPAEPEDLGALEGEAELSPRIPRFEDGVRTDFAAIVRRHAGKE